MTMQYRILAFFLIIGSLLASGCGHPSMDMMFNTSTEAYPVSTDTSGAALTALGGSATGATSLIRIEMAPISDAKMKSVWLGALALVAKEGSLRFIQQAKCYVQARSGAAGDPVLLGQGKAEDLSEDGKTMKLHIDSGPDLAGVLKNPFTITVEIEGDAPAVKTSIFAELTFKAHLSL